MCFSAGASFTAGMLLSFVGAETLRKVHKPSQIALASIPAFFAFQQFAEGALWLTLGQPGHAISEKLFTHIFLAMAQVVWPVLVPISVLLLEHNRTRKRILSALLILGIAIGFYYAYRLIAFSAHAEIIGNHIVYQDTASNSWGLATIIVYLAATIAPLFVSSVKRIYFVGIIMTISFIVSALFYIRCLTSVWCFFAAVISFAVFYIIRDAHKKFHFPLSPIPSKPTAS
jgi:hypothetical protein